MKGKKQTPTEHSKLCPNCGNTQYYLKADKLRRAIKNNTLCLSCTAKQNNAKRIRPIPPPAPRFIEHLDGYSYETGKWSRLCPDCNQKFDYVTLYGYIAGIKNNSRCKSCSLIVIRSNCDYAQIMPKLWEGRIKAWDDPNSGYYGENYTVTRIEAIKNTKRKNSISPKLKVTFTNHNGWIKTSKGEKELHELIKEYGFILNGSKLRIGKYFPDIVHENKKIIIEYNGDYYHANPNKYPNDHIFYQGKKPKTAKEIREYDRIRTEYLMYCGYTVYIVWEGDFKSLPKRKEIIEDIVNLTKNN